MSTTPIVDHEGLTTEWLEAALGRAGRLGGATAKDVTATRVGTGQIGACHRLDVTWAGPTDLPSRFVLKSPSADDGSRAFAAAIDAYGREVEFYREVAPALGARVPRCFAAEVAEDRRDFLLLLEDLSPATECGQLEGCTPEQAGRAIDEAADLHASSWRRPELQDTPWLRTGLGVWQSFGQRMGELVQAFVARYGDVIEPDVVDAARELADGPMQAWVETLTEPVCLWHGDFRLDNLLFDGAAGDVPLAIVDWQSVTMSQGTADVPYFVGAGVTTDVRRGHEDALMRRYHDRLVDRGVGDLSWESFSDGYRRNAVSGFVIALVASISVEQTARGDEMFLAMARRHHAQMRDHDTLALLAKSGTA